MKENTWKLTSDNKSITKIHNASTSRQTTEWQQQKQDKDLHKHSLKDTQLANRYIQAFSINREEKCKAKPQSRPAE